MLPAPLRNSMYFFEIKVKQLIPTAQQGKLNTCLFLKADEIGDVEGRLQMCCLCDLI